MQSGESVNNCLSDSQRHTTIDLVVEIVSDGERYFCHRSSLCGGKMLVSIATPSLVPLHAVRQKAWPTRCTSS